MPTTTTARDLLRKGEGAASRLDAAWALLLHLGWPERSVQPVQRDGREPLLQVATAGEPRALLVLGGTPDDRARPVSLGYSREAPFTLAWTDSGVRLLETARWQAKPGDTPLLAAERGDLPAAEDVIALLAPDSLVRSDPAGYADRGRRHEELAARLGRALAELRLQAAEAGVWSSRAEPERDRALLQLFHQLLYVRFQEDRGLPVGPYRLVGLVTDDAPSTRLESVLDGYRRQLNSALFAAPGLDVAGLPAGALRGVLRALTEPWDELRLDFSVSRSEIAGRLYQSYLALVPTRAQQQRNPTLFDRFVPIDAREKSASYYTPAAVARQLTEQTLRPWLLTNAPARPEDVRVLDPACGSGAFLIASYRLLLDWFAQRDGRPANAARRAEILKCCIFGADIDERAIGLAQIQLLEEARLPEGRLPELDRNLYVGDSLAAPPGSPAREGAVAWTTLLDKAGGFDVVITNPPFGSQLKLPSRLSSEERLATREPFAVRGWGSDYAYLFLDLASRLVAHHGSLGLILPRTFLDGPSARLAREVLTERAPVARIVDFRGMRLFPGLLPQIVMISTGSDDAEALAVLDSRDDAGRTLDNLAFGTDDAHAFRVRLTDGVLRAEAARGWSPFRLRWHEHLAASVGVEWEPLAPADGKGVRLVLQGTQPGDLRRFVVGTSEWVTGDAGRVVVDGVDIPERCAPRYLRSEHIRPFCAEDDGQRLLLPFERLASGTDLKALRKLIDLRGGQAPHPQAGALEHLLGPKILVRSFAREPAAVADTRAEWMTIKGTGGALAVVLPGSSVAVVKGFTALLHSALYQWLMRGFGRPRSDETVELGVAELSAMPWPNLGVNEWGRLRSAAATVEKSLAANRPLQRIGAYWSARKALDALVFDALAIGSDLRAVVETELVRAE